MEKLDLIYALTDPFENDVIRYIGKSSCGLARPREHFKASSRLAKTHKNNWINEVVDKGAFPNIKVIEYVDDPEFLSYYEIGNIAYYRSIGCKLTNGTDGGEGSLGRIQSDETKSKISSSHKGVRTGLRPHNKKDNLIIDGIEYRTCTICEQLVTLDKFTWVPARKVYHPQCKPCKAKRFREKRAANPPKKLTPEELKQSYIDRKESMSKGQKEYFNNNPEAKEHLSQLRSKPIKAENKETGEILYFDSAYKSTEFGFHNSYVGQAIKSGKPYRGYIWSFQVKEKEQSPSPILTS